MYRFRTTVLLSLVLCVSLTFLMVNSGTAGTSTADRQAITAKTQTFHPLVPRVASRTLAMQLERWDWDSGVAMYGMLKAWQVTGEQRFYDFVKSWVDGFIVRGLPAITHPNHATPGIATLLLYEETGHEQYLAASQQMATYLLHTAPRTADGALYHYEDQLWVDTLFVTVPFLSRFGRITGDPRYTDEAVRQFRLHAQHLQDPETGLFFHGWDESADNQMSGAFWQRGNGWAFAAGVELLDQLPADHPARAEIQDVLRRQAGGLIPLQDTSGLWHTVVDQPDFYLEASGAAAIGYGLFRGLDQGWLDPAQFNAAAQRTRHGLEDRVTWDGMVQDVSDGTGVAPALGDYNGISRGSLRPWGQGLALLLLSQRPYGFHLAVSPAVALVAPGESTWVNVVATAAYGPLPNPSLGVAGAPAAIAWQFTPNHATADLKTRLILTAATTSTAIYPLVVSAQTEDLVRTANLTLRIATSTYGVYLPFVAEQYNSRREPITRLTDDPAGDWQPTMAPDGRLAFVSDRSGAPRVYIQAPGDVPRRAEVWESVEEDRPLFSADGRLSFSVLSPYSQWDAVIYGDQPQIWFPVGRPSSNELHPAISPDGQFMTYVSDQSGNWEIYVIELRRVDPQLTFHVASDRVPSWSPDGQEIVFRSEWQGNSDIYVMDRGGNNLRRLTDDPAIDAWPSFSPDGQWILFQSDRAGNNDVYLMDREGGQVTRITTDPAEDVTPAWTPDGRHIIFASDRDGDLDIYRIAFTPPLTRALYPNYELANKVWQAVESFIETYPPAEIYPGYAPAAGGPSAESVRANVQAACHDFPDLPELFGEGAHHHACYEWVAGFLGLYHATSAYRSDDFSRPHSADRSDDFSRQAQDIAWAQHYLDADLDYFEEFIYGPEASTTGVSHRDTLAAIWQNPLRAVSVALIADLLHELGALDAERLARVQELLSGVARAWYAEFWETGQHPNPGTPFTIRTAPEVQAFSLAGHQVVSEKPWTFHWDADKGNTNAEEMAWMGAGIMLAGQVLGNRIEDASDIYAAARHYVDFAVSYNRPDPIHGSTIRTLNSETSGGAYGQRRYWLENHAPDQPSIPYVGFTWQFMNAALLASDLGHQQPWPDLVPDDSQWDVLLRSAGETMRAADGTFLVDFTPGRGIGFNIGNFPEWWVPCGQGRPGTQYVLYDGRAGGSHIFVSEIGHPAGLDLLPAGWALMRIAAARGDEASYGVWEGRLNQVLDEYLAHPPNPNWAVCKTAPYVSDNPGYHWGRMLAVYVGAYLGANGYDVGVWND